MEEKGVYAVPSLITLGFVTVFLTMLIFLLLVIVLVLFGGGA